MGNDISVTVIIPTFNGATWIRSALSSVLNQTSSAICEIIIVDDCSRDETLQLVASFEDPRIITISLKNNIGVAHARNVGLFYARGNCVAFNDQDDVWLPNKLEGQINALTNCVGAKGIIGGYARLAADGSTRWRFGTGRCNWSPQHIPQLRDSSRYNAATDDGCYLQSLLIYTEAARAVGGFREGLPLADDTDFIMRASERYPIISVPEVTFLYRLGDHNQTAPGVAKAQQFLAARAYVYAAADNRRSGLPEPEVLEFIRDYDPSDGEVASFVIDQELRLINTLLVNCGVLSAFKRIVFKSLWISGFGTRLAKRIQYWF